ncbi:Transposable element Tc3 transposase, partial [Araneus ventricosus]
HSVVHLEENIMICLMILENLLSRISLVGLWRLQNANHVVRSAGRLHKISLLPMIEQSSQRLPLDQN